MSEELDVALATENQARELAIVSASRPATKTGEDRVLLERFRGALERISVALGMPGSPDLAEDVPRRVEELLSIDDVNWRARELRPKVKGPLVT